MYKWKTQSKKKKKNNTKIRNNSKKQFNKIYEIVVLLFVHMMHVWLKAIATCKCVLYIQTKPNRAELSWAAERMRQRGRTETIDGSACTIYYRQAAQSFIQPFKIYVCNFTFIRSRAMFCYNARAFFVSLLTLLSVLCLCISVLLR